MKLITYTLLGSLCIAGCQATPVTEPQTDPETGEVTEVPTGKVEYVPDQKAAEEVVTAVAPFLPPPFGLVLGSLVALSAGLRAQKEGAA